MVDSCPGRVDALSEVEVHERGGLGGGGLTGVEGGVHVDGVGREDSGQDSVSLETVEDSFSGGNIGDGYLSGEGGRGGRGGAEAATDQEGGEVLIGDGGEDGGSEKIFLACKEE